MNILKQLSLPLLFILAIFSCEDDDASPTPMEEPNPQDTTMMDTSMMDTSKVCLHLFDFAGAPIGLYGDCTIGDNQWSPIANFEPEIESLFNFVDPAPPSDVTAPEVSDLIFYPTPIPSGRVVSIQMLSGDTSEVKLKLVFTDLDDNPIKEIALLLPASGAANLMIDEIDFPFGEPYRMYYKVLGNEDMEVLLQGYGNFAVCDALPVIDIDAECF